MYVVVTIGCIKAVHINCRSLDEPRIYPLDQVENLIGKVRTLEILSSTNCQHNGQHLIYINVNKRVLEELCLIALRYVIKVENVMDVEIKTFLF